MADTPTVPNTTCVTYHVWNADQTMIALSPNTNEVHIYVTKKNEDASKWELKWILNEHAGQVSGIDWCPSTNQIVTCGHDRNAYVWNLEDNVWKPTLVILRINRAATSVKWSPQGNKFAVGSGAKCVPVCQFDKTSNWWISKMIKKHKSTVMSLAWCVNNKFIVTGSADMKCRIFSAYLEGLDPADDDGFGEVFPKQHEFGEILAEFDHAKSWVHSVAWAPGGFRLAFGSHGSNLSFVQLLAGSQPIVQTINTRDLPYLDIQFLNDKTLIGAGFEGNIDLFTVTGGSETEPVWTFKDKVDKKTTGAAAATTTATSTARSIFTNADSKGTTFGAKSTEVVIATKHKNSIVNIQLVPTADGNVTQFTTAGIDGRVCFWDVKSLNL